MNPVSSKARALKFLPAVVFIAVMIIHFIWIGYSPYEDVQSQWIDFEDNVSWWEKYLASQDYYLGFSYSISFAFTALAFRLYQENSFCNSRKFAFGGLGFSGGIAVAGCFLVGCCGSPMLIIYSSLFGMKYANLAKPFIAGLTSFIILCSWLWMRKKLVPAPTHEDSTLCSLKTDDTNNSCC